MSALGPVLNHGITFTLTNVLSDKRGQVELSFHIDETDDMLLISIEDDKDSENGLKSIEVPRNMLKHIIHHLQSLYEGVQ